MANAVKCVSQYFLSKPKLQPTSLPRFKIRLGREAGWGLERCHDLAIILFLLSGRNSVEGITSLNFKIRDFNFHCVKVTMSVETLLMCRPQRDRY
jgi:hypothetical protein